MTFSLCMIVKNEAEILERCLDSISDLMDEIIIVDTGSTDQTKEIAQKYTDKVFDFEWDDDFSAARNFAFSKATMDYIYSADADEVLDEENHEKFRMLKEALLPEIEIVQMYYTNQLEYNTTYNFDEELRPKLYKRIRTPVWVDPLHESVRLDPVVFDSDIKIKHCPTSEHQNRDFAIFQKEIKTNGKLSEKLQKMYARELFISGSDNDFLTAEPYFKKRLDKDSSEELIMHDVCVLVKCARLRDDSDAMLYAAGRALAADDTPSEVVFELGEFYRGRHNYHEAVMWYYNAAFETMPILNQKYNTLFPFMGLHVTYVILGDREKAAKYGTLMREYQ